MREKELIKRLEILLEHLHSYEETGLEPWEIKILKRKNTPMKVTELHHHSDALFPDAGRRVPFGTGTSIVYKNCDYRFQNTTPYPVQIKVWLQDSMLMGEIRSTSALQERYRIKEENHHYSKEPDGYYRNSLVYQIVSASDGEELQKNLILQNHSKVLFDPALIPQEELRI